MRPGADPAREPQPLGVERLDYSAGRTGAGEGGEQVADGVLDAGVGVEHHLAGRVVDEARRAGPSAVRPGGLWKAGHPAAGRGSNEALPPTASLSARATSGR